MKIVSWNVNGLRACIGKGFLEYIKKVEADVICVQEIKLQEEHIKLLEEQIQLNIESYYLYWNCAEKKGYSGTAVFTRIKPLSVTYGMSIEEHNHEGRVITVEFDYFYVVNVYAPNAKRELERLDYRVKWEDVFRDYLQMLDSQKPVIVCGDMNVAHEGIDLKNPQSNRNSAGFTDQERDKFTKLLEAGFIDSYRFFYPDTKDAYTWWSYMFHAREKNIGWRIDYVCVSERLKDDLLSADIHSDVLGSDHCPVEFQMRTAEL